MKRFVPVMALLVMGCTQKEVPTDFNERILDLVIETRNGQAVSLPDLYPIQSFGIPQEKDEKLILSEKLVARGFKIVGTKTSVNGLSGMRQVTQSLQGQCKCEVTKTYTPSAFVQRYDVSEKISCK